MYYHYNHHPQYRCSVCGKRCGANGHASHHGQAECINSLPSVLLPVMVWCLHWMAGLLVLPIAWFIGWEWLGSVWGWLGWFWVAVTTLMVIAVKFSDWATDEKHKQDIKEHRDAQTIVCEGMKAGKTADVIMRELNNEN